MSEENSSQEKFLTFTLGSEFFALNIYSVREILDMTEITRIPQAPHFMRGVVNVRGNAVPVIDLRLKFGLGAIETTLNTRIIIVEIQRDEEVSVIGAIADSVKEVLEIESHQIDAPPKMGAKIKVDFIRGIGKRNDKFILLLDIAKVFSEEELTSMTGMEAPAPAALDPECIAA
jgi:purine-binding chemotaxis protein CheW